jgi:hypothetical protein
VCVELNWIGLDLALREFHENENLLEQSNIIISYCIVPHEGNLRYERLMGVIIFENDNFLTAFLNFGLKNSKPILRRKVRTIEAVQGQTDVISDGVATR